MTHRITDCPSSLALAAPSPIRQWLVRLAPLAALAVLGCVEDRTDAIGVADEASASDETASDETADDEAADEHGDLVAPGDDPLAQLESECEQRFACGCPSDRFADIAACEEYYMVEWAGIEAKAEAAALTADFGCYMQWMPHEAYGCDSYTENAEHAEPQACSYCQYAYGDRQPGESCQDFGGGVGDCAQGLVCVPTAEGVSQCLDPCSTAGPGESCSYVACDEGLYCDWLDATCRAAGSEGELCLDGTCEDGLVCDWLTATCTHGAGLGETCEATPCAPGLFCGAGLVCVTSAGLGESCLSTPCADGLTCRWDDATCAVPGQAGDGCVGIECAPGLFCDTVLGTCAPPGAAGETCLERPCLDGLVCDYPTSTCMAVPGLGEACSDVCADGLVCNYAVSPSVCDAWPVGGEPCVLDGCAANFVCDPDTHLCVDEPPMLCYL